MRSGRTPLHYTTTLLSSMPPVDRIERTVESLSWARSHFVEPPPAAKYVHLGLAIMCALHLLPALYNVYFGL